MPKAMRRKSLFSLAAAVLGTLLTPVVVGGQASAASITTWDKVARCESSNDWSYSKAGWPYYGGLQIVKSTWDAYGGTQYAAYPHQATKQQQILTAERILAGQGPKAWGRCAAAAGLASDHADPYPPEAPAPPLPTVKSLRWYLSDAGWSGVATRSVVEFGNTPMVPVVGDFDGNGSDTQSAYDPTTSTFYLTNSGNTAQSTMVFGVPGSRPVLGRWDGGTDQIGVYMPETGKFHLRREDGSVTAFAFGNGGDWRPVAGDWDGNGTETVGAYDPSTSTFYLRNSLSAGGADETVVFGNPNNIPITGDWDRSGRTDIGVYNPDNRTFYFRHGNGTVTSVTYGSAGDTPVTGDWDGDGYTTQGIVTTH
ncbi:transglycosylase family protein [Streptomyces sp. NPDC047718]|uniref:transglycosylase family protein n=1 Tax=Streptomyces sp. NPDC047718 TaxID=3155479 RepID=UPI0033C98986